MTKTDTITVRATEAEKWALAAVAAARGESLSSFLLTAALQVANGEVGSARSNVSQLIKPKRRRRKARPLDEIEFRTPFMQRRYATGFEEVVRHAARGMHTDEHSVGILMTYIAEAIGNVLATGGVVRWPALFVAAPYRIERGCRELCVPRFQANPPLRNHIEWVCPAERGRNRELDAHRRRRRPDRCGSLAKVLSDMRQGIMRQDKRICDSLESSWREASPMHWA